MTPPGNDNIPATQSQHTPEELARLGSEAFDRHVRHKLRPDDNDSFVAVDIVSGDHELDDDDYAAVMRLRTRRPTAEIWLGRVGQPAAYRMRRDK